MQFSNVVRSLLPWANSQCHDGDISGVMLDSFPDDSIIGEQKIALAIKEFTEMKQKSVDHPEKKSGNSTARKTPPMLFKEKNRGARPSREFYHLFDLKTCVL